jgi:DNA integrity scanning protein DisA with diadenylate cyclase activity
MCDVQCPLCPKKVRQDNLARHFGTHVVQFVKELPEEQRAEQIRTKNVILKQRIIVPGTNGIHNKVWAYCTVCKKLATGFNYDKFLKKHSTSECVQQWDRVSAVFQGGIVRYVQPKGVSCDELEEVKQQLEEEKHTAAIILEKRDKLYKFVDDTLHKYCAELFEEAKTQFKDNKEALGAVRQTVLAIQNKAQEVVDSLAE